MKVVKIICGKICSGKGYVCQQIIGYSKYKHVVVSDIVKSIINSSNRADLQQTKHLDQNIIEQCKQIIEQNQYVIFDGVRQLSILGSIVDYCKQRDYANDIIWVWAQQYTRQQRFDSRKDIKDTESLQLMDQKDCDLGLREVENFVFNNMKSGNIHIEVNNG